MRLLLHSFAAASVAVSFCAAAGIGEHALAGDWCGEQVADVEAAYDSLRDGSRDFPGRMLALTVDLAAGSGLEIEADGAFRYPMHFNDVAEGWSWRPHARPDVEDYYRWKFLPLVSRLEERGRYVQEEKIGTLQETRVQWRYDYFLVFDNPQGFYARDAADAGFSGRLSRVPSGNEAGQAALRILAVLQLADTQPPDSTTFWKAVHARPIDFTLRKRYFAGQLQAIVICDGKSEIARLEARTGNPAEAGAVRQESAPYRAPDQR